ncbi:MAG: 4Fe-4S ferredoxin, partial [Bacteroidota bacterium]
NADVVLAADCVAYAMGNFHHHFLKGKSLAIACPKLDSNLEVYTEKITQLINDSKINTLTVVIMEVPCCSGLMQIVNAAFKNANRKIPVKQAVISSRGELLKEEWML